MGGARFAHSATLMGDGHVLVAGGADGASTHASAERYDLAAGTWAPVANMGQARQWHSATLLPGDKVLVAGGFALGEPRGAELFWRPPRRRHHLLLLHRRRRATTATATRTPPTSDCDDANPAIHRGAIDTPGNGVDEDCSGDDAPVGRGSTRRSGSPSRPAGRRTVFTRLAVIPALAGSTVRLACSGKRLSVPVLRRAGCASPSTGSACSRACAGRSCVPARGSRCA